MSDELNPNPTEQQGQPAQQPPAAPAQPDFSNDAEFQAFQNQLQRYLGFGVSDLVGSVQAVKQLAAEREANLLRQQWGDQYQTNFDAVQARLNELHATNPQMAQSLNNAAGAKLIHAQLELERLQNTAPSVPGFQRTATPSTPQPRNAPVFKQSEIAAMTKDERRSRHAEITAAYANGLVSKD